jgi:hypothetical protein
MVVLPEQVVAGGEILDPTNVLPTAVLLEAAPRKKLAMETLREPTSVPALLLSKSVLMVNG